MLGTILDDFIDYIFCSSSRIPLRCLLFACWIVYVCLHLSYPCSSFPLPFPLFILLSGIFPPLSFLILLLSLSLLLWFLSLGNFSFLSSECSFLITPCSCFWVWCPFSLRTLRTASCCWHSRESFVSFGQPLFPLSCTFLLVALVPICYVKAVCRWLMAFDCQLMTKLRWHTAHWKLKSCCCCCYGLLFSQVRLCDPMGCSAPGFPFLHYLLEFAQTHVHWVSDAI